MNYILSYVPYTWSSNEQIKNALKEMLSNEMVEHEELNLLLNEFKKRSIDLTKIKIKNQNLIVHCIENALYSVAKVLIPFFNYTDFQFYQMNCNNQNIFHLLFSPLRITTKNQCDLVTYILENCFIYDGNQKSELLQRLLNQKTVILQYTPMNCFLQRPYIILIPKNVTKIVLNNCDLCNQNGFKYTMLSYFFCNEYNEDILDLFVHLAPQINVYNLFLLTQKRHSGMFEVLFIYFKKTFKNLFWNLERDQYDNYVQWFPNELVDDIFDVIFLF